MRQIVAVLRQTNIPDPGKQCLKPNFSLQTRERRSEAKVNALTKCQMSPRVRAADVESLGVGKMPFVAISRGIHEKDSSMRRNFDAAELGVALGDAKQPLNGRLNPQRFFD